MTESNPERIPIQAEEDIVLARHLGRNLSKWIGFGTIMQSRIATSISELARNIFLYAGEGTITIDKVERDGRTGLYVVAEDRGPGIPDMRRAMEDGFSTSGALGAGLPGVKRMMDEFLLESVPGKGTRVEIIKWLDDAEGEARK
ncbi:anti-sigma regulatory factor [Brevibacillus sp. H7]|uniref:anti-sigma regulatory factor n=1 Tax=Brevibacillus sp. H7 TaxID=3349138 RepID=UPI003822BD48